MYNYTQCMDRETFPHPTPHPPQSPPPPKKKFSNGLFLTINLFYYFKDRNLGCKINGLHHSTLEASETMGHRAPKCCISYKAQNYGYCCVKIPEKKYAFI